MKKYLVLFALLGISPIAKADLFGGDLPFLAQIVANTLNTIHELSRQSNMMSDELAGIHDRIDRIKTIADVVQPSSWEEWKDPQEAVRRLKLIYYTLPDEYRSKKSDVVADELSKAMNMIARIGPETQTTFSSGKELERRGADASPGVAQKLTASGVGTLISMEAQSQVIQSQVVSLLAQLLADANERESRGVVTKGTGFSVIAANLHSGDDRFSSHVKAMRWNQ